MEQEIIIEKITYKLKEYSQGKINDVKRGAETPRLAGLLLQKYGCGLVDAVTVFYDNPRVADSIYKILDEETFKIDPEWKMNNKERWESRPADIHTTHVISNQTEI